jgi:hypothetical protein
MARLTSILTALWAGSLCTICGLVAPTLFGVLDDRHLAGQLAAQIFSIAAWLGAVVGVVLLGAIVSRRVDTSGARRKRVDLWLIAVTAAGPLLSVLALRPVMEHARMANDMVRFGMLHGAAAVLFLAACAGALALSWRFNRPAE